MTDREVVERAYAAFNARNVDGALAAMHPDVEWPNGMEGGVVRGHAAVRAYWTRQWGLIDPRVDPVRIEADAAGRLVVDVHQVVRDLAGAVVRDQMVQHVYDVAGGLIMRMEIHGPPSSPQPPFPPRGEGGLEPAPTPHRP